MIACGRTGWSGCVYASRNPARVGRLVLWAVPPEGGDWGSDEARAAIGTAELDFRTFTETFAHAVLGWAAPERARQWARFMRRAMDEADFRLFHTLGQPPFDRTAVLSPIRARTLVMYPRRGGRVFTTAAAQRLAAGVAGAQLAFVATDPAALAPSSEEALNVTEDFLFDGSPPPRESDAPTTQQGPLSTAVRRAAPLPPSLETAARSAGRTAPPAEPRVQYTKTADGVTIAYWRAGIGSPVIDMGQPPATHVEMELRLAPLHAWYERFSRRHALVRFDTRGFGLSERDVDTYSLDTIVRDLEAVADVVAPSTTFTLMGSINTSPAAIAYAAKHPDRLDRLILWCPYAVGTEFFDIPGTPGLRRMLDEDWHMFTETASHSRFSWKADDHAREFAALWRAAAGPRVMALLMDSLRPVDVTPLLGKIRAPTLVTQRIDRGEAVARRISDGIPNAELVLVPGGSAAPYLEDADDVWRVIARFLGDRL